MSVREPGAAAPDLDEKHLPRAARQRRRLHGRPLRRRRGVRADGAPVLDTQHSHAVIAKMLRAQRATVLKGEYTPGQLLVLIGKFDFALGMRLHFLIFAAIAGAPFVALPYAGKVSGFLEALELAAPPINLVNPGRLIAYLDESWDRRALDAHAHRRDAARAAGARARDASHRARAADRRRSACHALKRPDGAPDHRAAAARRRCSRATPTCWWSAAARPGIGAALGAVQAGARVILAERYGFLGGNATAALVMPLMSFHTADADEGAPRRHHAAAHRPRPRRSRSSAACWPSCSRAWSRRRRHPAHAWRPATSCRSIPEWFKLVALDMLDEAGVQLLLHAFASGVLGDSAVEGRGLRNQVRARSPIRAKVTSRLHRRRRHRGAGGYADRRRPRRRPGAADDADVPHGRVPARCVRGLRQGKPEGVARRARPVGPGAQGHRRRASSSCRARTSFSSPRRTKAR